MATTWWRLCPHPRSCQNWQLQCQPWQLICNNNRKPSIPGLLSLDLKINYLFFRSPSVKWEPLRNPETLKIEIKLHLPTLFQSLNHCVTMRVQNKLNLLVSHKLIETIALRDDFAINSFTV